MKYRKRNTRSNIFIIINSSPYINLYYIKGKNLLKNMYFIETGLGLIYSYIKFLWQ